MRFLLQVMLIGVAIDLGVWLYDAAREDYELWLIEDDLFQEWKRERALGDEELRAEIRYRRAAGFPGYSK